MSPSIIPFSSQLSVNSREDVDKSAALIIREMNTLTQGHFAELDGFSRSLVQQLRNESRCERDSERGVAWRYLQFVTTISPLVMASSQGRLHDAFDMVALGLSDETDPQIGVVEMSRFNDFLSSEVITKIQLVEDILSWGRGFWYLARVFGTYTKLGEALFDLFLWLARQNPCKFQDAVPAYGQLAEWSIEHQYGFEELPRFVEILAICFSSSTASAEQRMNAALFLQGRVGQYAGFDRNHAAALARTHQSAQVRLQVAVQDWLLECGDLDRIIALSQEVRGELVNEDAGHFAQEVLFRTVSPVVYRLANDEQYNELQALLSSWRLGPGELDAVQIFIPAASGGSMLIKPGGELTRGPELDLEEITTAYNRFRQSTMTVRSVAFEAEVPDRPDIVTTDENHVYKNAVAALIDRVNLSGSVELPVATVPIDLHPFQAVMGASGRGISPWSVSLRRPRPDAKANKVLIFASDEMMLELEVTEVLRLLKAMGTDVKCIGPEHCCRDSLRAGWEDAGNDVLWLSGHGSFEGYAPDNAHLALGQQRVPFSEIRSWRTPERVGRRLIMLNACFGGAAARLEGVGQIGLATAVAGPAQAIVSHMWNSHWLPASCFGVLLASNINHLGFFGAFESSMGVLRAGADTVAQELRIIGADSLAERVLQNTSFDWNNLAAWGSACFFQ